MKSNKLRRKILDLSIEGGSPHIAPALSCVDILDTLYNNTMSNNDKFILSKGHGCLALYSILLSKGLKPDIYKGHPDIDIKNGIECTTGSLGHGLPIAVGMALAKKLKKEDGNIYVVMGDSELQEGTTWESFLIASHYRLNNLIVFIDNNELQALEFISDVLDLNSIYTKIKAFNCNVEVVNGHNINEIVECIENGFRYPSKPLVIIANTIKGKGVSYMENKAMWHAKTPTKEEYKQAYEELS